MITSIEAEEAFNKIQQPFMIKTFNKIGLGGHVLNSIYEKLTAIIIPSGEDRKLS